MDQLRRAGNQVDSLGRHPLRPWKGPGNQQLACLVAIGALAAGLGCPAPVTTDDDDDDSAEPPASITQVAQIAGSYTTTSGHQLLAEGTIDLQVQESTLEIGEDGSYSESTGSIMAVVSDSNPRFCSRTGTGTVTIPIPDHFNLSVELTFANESLSVAPDSCLIAGTYGVDLKNNSANYSPLGDNN